MLEERSTPAIIKIDGKEVGSCFIIQNYEEIPMIFCPQIPLQAKMVKDAEWEEATKDIALIVLPTLAPLPFGRDIESTMLNNDFIKEMAKITVKHGFWAKMMVDAFEQEDTKFDTLSIFNNLNMSKAVSKGRDPFCAATKGFQDGWPLNSSTSINTSCVGRKHKVEQAKMKDFYHRNPTPFCVEIIDDNNKQIPIQGFTATTSASNRTNAPAGVKIAAAASSKIIIAATTTTATAAITATAFADTGLNATTAGNPPKEFYNQLSTTMRNLQQAAPLHQQKML